MLAEAPILLQSAPEWLHVPVRSIREVSPKMRAIGFNLPWGGQFRAGQCVDVRLTAADGYQAQRYYSISTAPSPEGEIEVLVERQEGGEVSTFLHDTLQVGDVLELRGPIGGGPFTWGPSDPGPILLIGGGSGVSPLLSMLRHRQAAGCRTPFSLVYSTRRRADVLASDELLHLTADPTFRLTLTLTRETEASPFRTGRLDAAALAGAMAGIWANPAICFICGSNDFVGDICDMLLAAGLPPHRIRTERFG